MSDEILERLRAVAIVVMLACIAHAAGCKSAPIAPYNDTVTQIDQMIADLKASADPVAAPVRKKQIATLEKSRAQIVKLSAENATEAGWSGAAKGAATAGGVMLVVVGAVVWLRRK